MYKKIFLVLFLFVFIMAVFCPLLTCAEVGGEFDYNLIPNRSVNQNLKTPFANIWKTAIIVLQVASIAGVVIAGVRYMFASSDQKADIKKGLIHLVVGCVIVFGAVTVISIITQVFNEIV